MALFPPPPKRAADSYAIHLARVGVLLCRFVGVCALFVCGFVLLFVCRFIAFGWFSGCVVGCIVGLFCYMCVCYCVIVGSCVYLSCVLCYSYLVFVCNGLNAYFVCWSLWVCGLETLEQVQIFKENHSAAHRKSVSNLWNLLSCYLGTILVRELRH